MNPEFPEHSPNRRADQDDPAGQPVSDSERCLRYLLGEASPSEQAAFAEELQESAFLNEQLLQEAEFLSGLAAMEWGTTTAVSDVRSEFSGTSSTDALGDAPSAYPTAVVPRWSKQAAGWSCLLSAAVVIMVAVIWRYGLPGDGLHEWAHDKPNGGLRDGSHLANVSGGQEAGQGTAQAKGQATGNGSADALVRSGDDDRPAVLPPAAASPLSEELMAGEVAQVIAEATSLDDLVPLENVLDDSADELEASLVEESFAEPFETKIGESEEWILTATFASMQDDEPTEDRSDERE